MLTFENNMLLAIFGTIKDWKYLLCQRTRVKINKELIEMNKGSDLWVYNQKLKIKMTGQMFHRFGKLYCHATQCKGYRHVTTNLRSIV